MTNPEMISISLLKCKYSGVELIVGGENADQGEFPHMAAIGFTNFDDGYNFSCGGSLISPRFVLTAGHCTRNLRAKDPEPVIVRLGDQNIDPSVSDGANPVDVPIKRIHKHPDYRPPARYNDIALLELNLDMEIDSDIRPACLWQQNGFGGETKAIATGWGTVNPDTREVAKDLQKVSVNLLNNTDCAKLLDTRHSNLRGLSPSQMCAGELRGRKDTCRANSGSPLQIPSKDKQCIFHIIGITSFGEQCANGPPAVYTRISSYLDWIEGIVWPGE
ncbi:serine protease Hayan-like [Achroia grisella]|uniref:serine protease Hayan-like n=1 Tax=Achroia grisella TaxID=688607 RepID=UPI0027D2D24B|nr:serine protease Hayan-like [Achroia grisella]